MKSLVDTLSEKTQSGETTLTKEALKEFSELAKNAGITNMPGVSRALSNMFSSGVLNTLDAGKLQNSLDEKQLQKLNTLRRLQKAGVLSSNQCAQCMKMLEKGMKSSAQESAMSMSSANKKLQSFLQQNDSKMLSSLLMPVSVVPYGRQRSSVPDTGLGSGHVPLTLGAASPEGVASYKTETISTRAFNTRKESMIYKIEKGMPTVESGEESQPGALQSGGGRSKQTGHRVLPRHRTAVQTFFDK